MIAIPGDVDSIPCLGTDLKASLGASKSNRCNSAEASRKRRCRHTGGSPRTPCQSGSLKQSKRFLGKSRLLIMCSELHFFRSRATRLLPINILISSTYSKLARWRARCIS